MEIKIFAILFAILLMPVAGWSQDAPSAQKHETCPDYSENGEFVEIECSAPFAELGGQLGGQVACFII